MKILLSIIIFVFTPLAFPKSGIELDIEYLNNAIKDNQDDIATRVILANFYLEEGDLAKSKLLIDHILKKDGSNQSVIMIHNKWIRANKRKIFLNRLNISDIENLKQVNLVIKEEYKKGEFTLLIQLFDLLGDSRSKLNSESKIVYASVLVHEKKFKKSINIIQSLPDQSDQRVKVILSKACYALKDMECAIPLLQTLFDSSADFEIGLLLVDALISQGRTYEATPVYENLKKRKGDHPKIHKLGDQLAVLFSVRVKKAENSYQEKPTSKNFVVMMRLLIQNGESKKYNLELDAYIKKNPHDDEIKFFAANQYAINKEYSLAIKILKSLDKKTPSSQLVLAKYMAWSGKESKEAKTILVDLLKQPKNTTASDTSKISQEASLLLANMYLWEGEKNKASAVLEPIVQSGAENDEIAEAYLLATNKNNVLIEKYKLKLQKDKNNAPLILKIARLYQSMKKSKKALKYFEQYISINPDDISVDNEVGLLYLSQKKYTSGFKFIKRHADKVNTEKSLLNLANHYYWNGFNKKSLTIAKKVKSQYPHSKKARLLISKLEGVPLDAKNKNFSKAIKHYDKKEFKAAIPFFREYLKQYSNDSFTRFKYAYSYEKVGGYTKAIREFKTILRARPNDLKVQYFLAYNLELVDKKQKAKGIYSKIIGKENKYKKITKSDSKFKKLASERLAFIEKNKDTIINGIYLGGGGTKVLESESQVFSNVFVSPSKVDKRSPYSSFIAEDVLYHSMKDMWRVDVGFEHVSDRAGVSFINPSVSGSYKTWPYEINVAGNGFRFGDDGCSGKLGGSVELSGKYNKSISTQIGGGLKVDQFEGHTEFSPFINLSLAFDTSNLDLQAYKRSLFYEKLSCDSFTEHHSKYGVQISGNVELTRYQSLWYSIDAGYIDDGNVEIIPQYSLIVFKDKYDNKISPIEYELAIDGYYVWNKKQMDSYYSPHVFDSTVLSFNPTFIVNKEFNLALQGSVGYSFSEKSAIFRYGIWGNYLLGNVLRIRAGCERSNIGSSSAGGSDYNYNQCVVSLGYDW